MSPVIEESWKHILYNEFKSEYFIELKKFLISEKQKNIIYPPGSEIFAAFDLTPFNSVKVVILGQDPYHGKNQANGLCFSVSDGIRKPPSLQNIFKELHSDLRYPIPESGNLEKWAREGVLLINATLTVRAGNPGSHQNRGWETFTDATIKAVSDHKENIVFILWGKFAQDKEILIDTDKHKIIRSPHPSPFSADRGFFGSQPFSRANNYLIENGSSAIEWKL
ncbi:MAG: uracil-DNA glycosylase [Bacteroidales bacterium]|nr:uracil-DNA glycosylase [Bacteroidales bacterium]